MTTQQDLRERIVPILRELYGHGRTAGWGTRTDLVENAADQIIALLFPPDPGDSYPLASDEQKQRYLKREKAVMGAGLASLVGQIDELYRKFEADQNDKSVTFEETEESWKEAAYALMRNYPALRAALTTGGWRDAINDPPDPGRHVLMLSPGKATVAGYISEALGYGWRTCPGDHKWKPTHWMPLPAPPPTREEG